MGLVVSSENTSELYNVEIVVLVSIKVEKEKKVHIRLLFGTLLFAVTLQTIKSSS